MNCKDAQEIILTDYVDNELGGDKKSAVDKHVAQCRACKEFLDTVTSISVEPFSHVRSVPPPEYVWRRIKAAIVSDSAHQPGWREAVMGFVRRITVVPRPIFAAATVLVLALIVGGIAQFGLHAGRNSAVISQAQTEYLDYVSATPYNVSSSGSGYSAMPIEEYFM